MNAFLRLWVRMKGNFPVGSGPGDPSPASERNVVSSREPWHSTLSLTSKSTAQCYSKSNHNPKDCEFSPSDHLGGLFATAVMEATLEHPPR